jgi:hypothetical protein
MLRGAALGAALFGIGVVAQFPPRPEGVTVLKSKFHENVTISFKEVGGHLITYKLTLSTCNIYVHISIYVHL